MLTWHLVCRLLTEAVPGEEAAELLSGLPSAPGLRRAVVSAEEDALKVPSTSTGEVTEEISVPGISRGAARADDRCRAASRPLCIDKPHTVLPHLAPTV